MKKTFLLTALLGLCGALSTAETLTLKEAFVTMDATAPSPTTSHHFVTAQSGMVYTFALLDLAEFKKLASSSGSDTMLISYKNERPLNVGIGRGSYDSSHPLRFYNKAITDTPSGGGWCLTQGGATADPYTLNGLSFDNVVGAVLTMGVKHSDSTFTCLSLMRADGTFTDYAYEAPGYKASRDYTDVAISSTYVDKAYVYLEKSFTTTTLAEANHDVLRALVPEPTTATLSLLALAGLAARRRRQ